VRIPNPEHLDLPGQKIINKWFREHVDLQYVMDAANKTERISAPDGKHDDFCDSSVLGIHATLAMLPGSATVATSRDHTASARLTSNIGRHSGVSLFKTRGHDFKVKGRYSL
jgi:hypothetical protein